MRMCVCLCVFLFVRLCVFVFLCKCIRVRLCVLGLFQYVFCLAFVLCVLAAVTLVMRTMSRCCQLHGLLCGLVRQPCARRVRGLRSRAVEQRQRCRQQQHLPALRPGLVLRQRQRGLHALPARHRKQHQRSGGQSVLFWLQRWQLRWRGGHDRVPGLPARHAVRGGIRLLPALRKRLPSLRHLLRALPCGPRVAARYARAFVYADGTERS